MNNIIHRGDITPFDFLKIELPELESVFGTHCPTRLTSYICSDIDWFKLGRGIFTVTPKILFGYDYDLKNKYRIVSKRELVYLEILDTVKIGPKKYVRGKKPIRTMKDLQTLINVIADETIIEQIDGGWRMSYV